ncbi:MAG: pyridoxamine 5'-phosphate oxidase family protein [Jatrophihabitans sp.]
MPPRQPRTELDPRYSEPDAPPVPWAQTQQLLAVAELSWLTTVRPDSRPHVTPLITVWVDDALWFSAGAEERKVHNAAENKHCALTTGSNALHGGTDVVVEGEVHRETDESVLRRVAEEYETKYGNEWHYTVRDGSFIGTAGNVAQVFRMNPTTAFAYGKAPYSQTRYRFD